MLRAFLLLATCRAGHGVVVDTAQMWRELEAHCSAGNCAVAKGSKIHELKNTTDCKGRLLAYEYGLSKIPARAPQLESFDALELATTCGVTRPPEQPLYPLPLAMPQHFGDPSVTFHVDPDAGSDTASGRPAAPFRTILKALQMTRAASAAAPKSIVLQPGTHFLNATIELTAADSGLTITAAPGAKQGSVVVSGGVVLSPAWTKSPVGKADKYNIWVTDVPEAITEMRGLTTLDPHRRVTRAREPNADPSEGAELCTRCWHNRVKQWHSDLSCIGQATTVYKDLRNCDDHGMLLPDSTSPCKNDSAMWNTYNTYSNGHGGCCAVWSGDHSPYGPMGNCHLH